MENKIEEWQRGLPVTPGEAMLVLRRRKGWTQVKLAQEAGLSLGLISRAERDDFTTLLSTYQAIFEALDCSILVRLANVPDVTPAGIAT